MDRRSFIKRVGAATGVAVGLQSVNVEAEAQPINETDVDHAPALPPEQKESDVKLTQYERLDYIDDPRGTFWEISKYWTCKHGVRMSRHKAMINKQHDLEEFTKDWEKGCRCLNQEMT